MSLTARQRVPREGEIEEDLEKYVWRIHVKCTTETGRGLTAWTTTVVNCRVPDIADVARVETRHRITRALGNGEGACEHPEKENLEHLS